MINQILTIRGGNEDGRLALRLKAGDATILEIDDFDDAHVDFSFNRTEFTSIIVNAGAGNDIVRIDDVNGVFTDTHATTLNGGAGDDTLSGGGGAETLDGGPGNDTLNGNDGNDLLNGGDDDDTLTGGRGDDQSFGGDGSDRMVWNPGDGTDLNEGGAGLDTVEVNGGNGDEQFAVTANGTRVRFDRVNPAPFAIDIGTSETLQLNCNAGNDQLSCAGNLAALIQIKADGGPGDDSLLGSNGADELSGGEGNDFIDGQQGNDKAFMGAGNDTFQWDPGDGSDIVEGQEGSDIMIFNGSAASEIFNASANGQRLLFTRNIGNILMDLNEVEQLDVRALAGADSLTVNDLAGVGVALITANLAGTLGGAAGDAAADSIIINGGAGNDSFQVSGAGTAASIDISAMRVNITDAENANDLLTLNGAAGNDSITAALLPSGILRLTIDGGADNDSINGSTGADVILGGDGDDLIIGDSGADTVLMGDGNDTFQWDPGDSSDVIEGQAGIDTLLFNGSNASENIQISANGGRAVLFRDVAAITMDINDTEVIDVRVRGGTDSISILDMTGTDVINVRVDLSATAGGGDSANDTINVSGTQAADVFGAISGQAGISTFGLQATVEIAGAEPANDQLALLGQGGNDVVDTSSLAAGQIRLTMNGGLGADVLLGGPGDESMTGGDGDDTALMGGGNDVFFWFPGDDNDTLEGQAGIDTMQFAGSGASEQITLSANGGRLVFTRDVASVTMDLNDVEIIDFAALGGVDRITVNSLAATDVTLVNIDLESSPGSGVGDNAADSVTVNGTANPDTIDIAVVNGAVEASGLAARVRIEHSEPALDLLTVNGLGGVDSISVGGGVTTLIMVNINQ